MDDVVKCTVMLADISEWETFNEIYGTFFNARYSARSALGANGLALGAREVPWTETKHALMRGALRKHGGGTRMTHGPDGSGP